MKPKAILFSSFLLLLVFCPALVRSIPQVAVLDALLPEDFDSAAKIPITDKLIEELVNSKKFVVLDRDSVEQVLREKEFQLTSGLVKNEEIRKAGEYLGADYVVVARVSKLGSTFFMSARMIDVKTGAIFAQTSDQSDGPIDVLLEIARRTGVRLAGGVVEEAMESRPASARPARERPAAPAEAPAQAPPQTVSAAPSRGELQGVIGAKVGGSLSNIYGDSVAADVQDGLRFQAGLFFSIPMGGGLGMLLELAYSQKGYDLERTDLGGHYVYREYFHYFEAPMMLQLFLPLSKGSRLYLAGGGYMATILSADWEKEYDTGELSVGDIDMNTSSDFDYGLVAGMGLDFLLGGMVLNLDARYSLGMFTVNNTGLDICNTVITFSVGLGSRM